MAGGAAHLLGVAWRWSSEGLPEARRAAFLLLLGSVQLAGGGLYLVSARALGRAQPHATVTLIVAAGLVGATALADLPVLWEAGLFFAAGGFLHLAGALSVAASALRSRTLDAGGRRRIASGVKWEALVGYSRLVRAGRHLYVTGTTATLPGGGHTGDGDAHAQAAQAIRNIEWALTQAGAALSDVVRTRIFVVDIQRDWEAVGRAHAAAFGRTPPATSMVQVSRLIDDWMLVEIEADAVLDVGD